MAALTRLSLDGYGAKRAGSFAGKEATTPSSPHTPGRITRLSLDGYGVKRAGSFAGKEESGIQIISAPGIIEGAGSGKYRDKKYFEDEAELYAYLDGLASGFKKRIAEETKKEPLKEIIVSRETDKKKLLLAIDRIKQVAQRRELEELALRATLLESYLNERRMMLDFILLIEQVMVRLREIEDEEIILLLLH